jgi:hypothetical protein
MFVKLTTVSLFLVDFNGQDESLPVQGGANVIKTFFLLNFLPDE